MSIAGGLLPTENLPKQKRDSGYAPAGDGRFVVLPNGMKMAAEWKKGDEVPEGHAVINIDYGKDNTEMGPVPVTHGDWTIVIPRGTDRVVPLQHMNILNDAIPLITSRRICHKVSLQEAIGDLTLQSRSTLRQDRRLALSLMRHLSQ